MKTTKKKIIILVTTILLFGLAIVLLPLPKRINTTLPGVRFSDTSELEDVTIAIKGWYLNYLFRDDNLKGTVTIVPYNAEKAGQAVFEIMTLFSPPDNDLQFSSIIRFSGVFNNLVHGTIVFDRGFGTVVLEEYDIPDSYYIASEKPLDEVTDTIERFKRFLGR